MPNVQTTRYIRVKLVINHPEGMDTDHVLNEMDYTFTSTVEAATISDTHIAHIEEYEDQEKD